MNDEVTRALVATAIGVHAESYDSDCGYYYGCECGWDNGTADHNDGYPEHVADQVMEVLG